MLKTEHQQLISKLLNIDYKTLEAAIKAETETEVTLPDGQLFTPTELESRDKATKAVGYKEGKEAGEEIVIKTIREKHGLEFEGKDAEKMADAFKAKVLADAKIEPAKALQEKDAIISKLQSSVQTLESEKTEAVKKTNGILLRTEALKAVPAVNGLKPEQVLTLMETDGYSYEKAEDGSVVWKKGGNVLRNDKDQTELKGEDVVGGFIANNGWNVDEQKQEQRNGRGGGNSGSGTGKPTKLSEAEAQWQADGKHIAGAEFQAHVTSLTKENPNFDLDN